jgi:hypothetical protein
MGQIMSTIPELESGTEEKASKGASRRHAEPYAGGTSGEGSAQSVVDLFEKGFARIRDTHKKMSEVQEDASEAFNQAFTIANRGSIEFRMKMIEMLHANLRAWQDAARHLIAAKSPSEFVEIAANQTRRHIETATVQAQELSELTRKVAKGTASSISAGLSEPSKLVN